MTTAGTVQLHAGVRLHADPRGGLLVGGQPLVALRLNAAAAAVVQQWRQGVHEVEAAHLPLARRLDDAGVAVWRPAQSVWTPADVTVVVPAHNRPELLDQCLASLGACAGVIVVDDASHLAVAVAEVARAHGARLVVRPGNGGPAAARNTGLREVSSPLVAFVDCDCVLPPNWLSALVPLLGDPTVAVVAPRTAGRGGTGLLERFEQGAGPLDLGKRPGLVGPGRAVSYVPAAVMLCRREALGEGFDAALRVGEDVDLVWRLIDDGWRVRYEPAVVAAHQTRPDLRSWWSQRHAYGLSAASLSRRHPGRVPPVVVSPWMLPALILLAARRPAAAAAAIGAIAAGLHSRLPPVAGRPAEAVLLASSGLVWTALGLTEAVARTWLPGALAAAALDRRARRAVAAAIAVRLARRRPAARPAAGWPVWTALSVLDDLAYGTGVWRGCLRTRHLGPVLPRPALRGTAVPSVPGQGSRSSGRRRASG